MTRRFFAPALQYRAMHYGIIVQLSGPFIPTLLLSGCIAYRAPQLELSDVTLHGSTPDGTGVSFELQLQNSNDVPLELRTFEYVVIAQGHEPYHGRHAPNVALPARGSQRVTIPAVIVNSETAVLQESAADISIQGSLNYITPGQIAETLFDARLHKPRVSFSFSDVFEDTIDAD